MSESHVQMARPNMLRTFLTGAPSRFTPEQRAEMARLDGRALADGGWQEAEKLIADQILRILAKDAEAVVRQALAEALADSKNVPRDIALALAEDLDEVALPVLRHSQVLGSEDFRHLAEISQSQAKLAALAARRGLNTATTDILIEKGSEGIVITLLRNDEADLSESGLHKILDRHGASDAVQSGVVHRHVLPVSIVERLVALISTHLMNALVEKHPIPADIAATLAVEVRERATIGLATGLSEDAVSRLLDHLETEGRLSPGLLMQSICTGNTEFLIQLLSRRCRVGTGYVRGRLVAGDMEALRKFWKDAHFPAELLVPAEISLRAMVDSISEAEKWDAGYYRSRIVERILTALDAAAIKIDDELAETCVAIASGPKRQLDLVTE